ncbi:MAG: YbbR-like domain-containing protein [Polyangiaceae bacterium]|nr:YbbR-like domain-containing protein [Polyangiaceae bacterium]
MTKEGGIQRFIYDALFENVGLKLISILCALGFFVFIRGSERAEMRFDVGIAHTVPPESARRILVKEPPTGISVTLRGPKTQLESLPRDLGTITLDLSTGHESVIELTPSMVPNLPTGVDVVQLFPARIDVRWDDIVSRAIPVTVTASGIPAPGYKLRGDIVMDPPTITATGPRAIIELIQSRSAGTFDLTELSSSEERQLTIELPPQDVEYNTRSVTAIAEIVPDEKEIPFKSVRVEVVGAPKATTRPETVTVKVSGAADVVTAVEADQIVPRVELPEGIDLSKPGSVMAKVLLDIPNTKIEVEPKQVLVKW